MDPRPFWLCKEGFGEQPCPEVSWRLECWCWCWCGKECTSANKCLSSIYHRIWICGRTWKFEKLERYLTNCVEDLKTKFARFNPARHSWARVFSRPFLAWPEGSGVQTSCVQSSEFLFFFMLLFLLMVICWIVREHYQGCLWPSGCWLFPWIMLATDSLTALCYCLHHLHQFDSFQLGNKYIGFPCVLHGLLQLCNTWLSTYMHGCMVDLCTCNCYPTKDIHVPWKSLKPRANRRVRQPLKGGLGASATDNTVAVFIVGFVSTKTDFP